MVGWSVVVAKLFTTRNCSIRTQGDRSRKGDCVEEGREECGFVPIGNMISPRCNCVLTSIGCIKKCDNTQLPPKFGIPAVARYTTSQILTNPCDWLTNFSNTKKMPRWNSGHRTEWSGTIRSNKPFQHSNFPSAPTSIPTTQAWSRNWVTDANQA